MYGIDTNELVAHFTGLYTHDSQPFLDDIERQLAARLGARTGIGNLPFADVAVEITERGFEGGRPSATLSAADGYAVRTDFTDLDLRKIGNHIRCQIGLWIVNFIEQLFLAGGGRDLTARTGNLGDDGAAVGADFADRKAQSRQIGDILDAGIGKIAAGDLSCALQQMTDQRTLAKALPVVGLPAEFMD